MTAAPATLALTGHLLTRDHGHTFTPVHVGGPEWTLVSVTADGIWTLTTDSNLAWYPGDTFGEDGREPEFEAQIDCTTPQHIAAAAHNIIAAPAHLRAYVAAVEGPNVPPIDSPADLAPGWTYNATRSNSQYTFWTNPAHYGSEISVSTTLTPEGYWVHQHGEFVGRYTTREQAIKVIETGKSY